MRQHLTLLRLFWQQLIRRKSLWIVVGLAALVSLINLAVYSQMQQLLEQGVRYDIATRRAVAQLEGYAGEIRVWAFVLVVAVAALVAPPARRDGTTQFVLGLSVSRRRLALAQFGALALFLLIGTLVTHLGYSVAAWRLGVLRIPEALFAWVVLYAPLLLAAAPSFALSLTRPALVVYGVLLGIPYLLLTLLESLTGIEGISRLPVGLRVLTARVFDNLQLFFPDWASLIPWPELVARTPERPPLPALGLEWTHAVAASLFWVVWGVWAYRRFDLGSRTLMK